MSDDNLTSDADIILQAYAEKVRENFKIFAENLGMGQNYQNSTLRFIRAMELTRKARDMALDAIDGVGVVERTSEAEGSAATDPNKVSAADMSRRSARAVFWSEPGARPRPRSMRPGCSSASVPNCSAITSGA